MGAIVVTNKELLETGVLSDNDWNNANNIMEACEDFCRRFRPSFTVGIDNDFQCDPLKDEIDITLITVKEQDEEFLYNLLQYTNIRDISDFTWSLLHELGHCMTQKKLSISQRFGSRYNKWLISKGKLPSTDYYNLDDELTATMWGICFTECNHQYVKNFDNKIMKLFNKFYTESGLLESED